MAKEGLLSIAVEHTQHYPALLVHTNSCRLPFRVNSSITLGMFASLSMSALLVPDARFDRLLILQANGQQ